MKHLKFLTALIFFAGFSTSANALTIDPTVLDCTSTEATAGLDCYAINSASGSNPEDELADILGLGFDTTGFSLLYKSEVPKTSDTDPSIGEESSTSPAPYDSSYETQYFNSPTDPQNANIVYTGGASIECPDCFLYIKDGNQTPNAYVIDLGTLLSVSDLALWDGLATLELRNFWTGPGAISHVSIYGVPSPIPVPAAVWLFGTALIGFIGFSRRTSV